MIQLQFVCTCISMYKGLKCSVTLFCLVELVAMMKELSVSFPVVSFNIGKYPDNSLQCSTITKYFEQFDLLCLQEVKKDDISRLGDNYSSVYLKEKFSGQYPCNYIIYNNTKFKCVLCKVGDTLFKYALDESIYTNKLPQFLKSFTEHLKAGGHDNLDRRVCLVVLQYIGNSSGWQPRIIVACFHNLYTHTGKKKRTEHAAHLFDALDRLRRTTGYPVLVAGDFNCELLKDVDTHGFTVPKYNPTIHRVLTAWHCS